MGLSNYQSKQNPFVIIGKSLICLVMATVVSYLLSHQGFSESNMIIIYIFSVIIIGVITTNRLACIVSAMISVIVFNFLFTEPRFTLFAYDQDYPFTFAVMFGVAVIIGTLAVKQKSDAYDARQNANRTQIILETNRMLQQADNEEEIIASTMDQLEKLLGREVFYTNRLTGRKGRTYYPIGNDDDGFGYVSLEPENPELDPSETSILLSLLGECAFALKNERNLREKEEAAVLAKNEQMRATMLRGISHDLRTPLTSIHGNASNLISNSSNFDEETKIQMYHDMQSDSVWLINLVENLLSVTRIEDGRMQLHFLPEMVDEMVREAISHYNRNGQDYNISFTTCEDLLLARMDVRLMVQVMTNLIDNGIKYGGTDPKIWISTKKEDNWIYIRVKDHGPGIKKEEKDKIFDMFYCGDTPIADGRRSMGLGLYLCKTIVTAHNGKLYVEDASPQGSIFTIKLHAEEVSMYE